MCTASLSVPSCSTQITELTNFIFPARLRLQVRPFLAMGDTTLHPPSSSSSSGCFALFALRELRQLRLARCPKLRDAHLAPLSHLGHSLTLLDVRGCQALTGRTLELLQHLPLLTHLDLSGEGCCQ